MADRSQYPPPEEMERRKRKERAQRAAIAAEEAQPDGSRRAMSGLILWLAGRLGQKPEQLAARIDDDTIRRTKYPYVRAQQPDGTTVFREVASKPGTLLASPVEEGSSLDDERGGIEIRRREK